MLFVFGFRANKIRSKKLSVLIHNSERHQNISSCTVKVHFQRIIDTGVGSCTPSLYDTVVVSEVTLSLYEYIRPTILIPKNYTTYLHGHGFDSE